MEIYKILFSGKELLLFSIVTVIILLAIVVSVLSAFKRIRTERDICDNEAEIYSSLWYASLVRGAERKYSSYIKQGYQDRLPEISDVLGKEVELLHLIDKTESMTQEEEVLKKYEPDIILSLVRYKYEGFEDFSPKEVKRVKKMMEKYGITPAEETKGPLTGE